MQPLLSNSVVWTTGCVISRRLQFCVAFPSGLTYEMERMLQRFEEAYYRGGLPADEVAYFHMLLTLTTLTFTGITRDAELSVVNTMIFSERSRECDAPLYNVMT